MFARLERAQSIPSTHFLEVNAKDQRENKKVFNKLSEEKKLFVRQGFSNFPLEGLNKTFSLQVGE